MRGRQCSRTIMPSRMWRRPESFTPHNYGCAAQFLCNFDLAVSQADHPEVFAGIHSEGEGIRLVRQTARYLVSRRRPWLVPGLIVKSGFKYAGYRLGRCYRILPVKLAAACSMNKEYWK